MKSTKTKNPILDAAIKNFVRYGLRKTSMSDIAMDAGISRPTLYASFKNKDEVLAAVIRYYTEGRLNSFQERSKLVDTLGEKLDFYFDDLIVAGYDLLKNLPEGQEARTGITDSGLAAFEEVRFLSSDALVEILMPYQTKIISTEQTVEQLAYFIVNASAGFRQIVASREALLLLLASLKTMVLAVTKG